MTKKPVPAKKGYRRSRSATRLAVADQYANTAYTDATTTWTSPLTVANDSGLTIKNTAATRSVAITATAATELTFGGTIVASGVTASDLTAGRVVMAGTAGRLSTAASFVFENLTSDPGTPVEGQAYWNPTTNALMVYDGAAFVNVSAGGGITGTLVSGRIVLSNGTSTVTTDANLTYTSNLLTLNSGRMLHSAGSITNGQVGNSLTVTMPSSPSSTTYGAKNVTTSGSGGAGVQIAGYYELATGHTGSALCLGLDVLGHTRSTGANITGATGGNVGIRGVGNNEASTGGTAVGVFGDGATAGTGLCYGVFGWGHGNGASSKSIGVAGLAPVSGTTQRAAGYFKLAAADINPGVSGALVCDNGTSTDPIFIAIDGTTPTTVFEILNGGKSDHHKFEANNFTFENRTSDIGSPVEGLAYWQSSTNKLRIYDGSAWVDINSAGITGTLANGQVVYATGTGTVDSDNVFLWDTSTKTLTLGNGASAASFALDVTTDLADGNRVFWQTSFTGSDDGACVAYVFNVNGSTYSGSATVNNLQLSTVADTSNSCTGIYSSSYRQTGGTNTGLFMGLLGAAGAGPDTGALTGLGVVGKCDGGSTTGFYVGVAGFGTSTDSDVRMGGYFNSTAFSGVGGFSSITATRVGLMVESGASGDDILSLRSGNTTKLKVLDTGAITCALFTVTSSTSVTLTSASTYDLSLASGNDIVMTSSGHATVRLGDNAGLKVFDVRDSDDTVQFNVTSDGDGLLRRTLAVGLSLYTPFLYSSNFDGTKPGFARGVMAVVTTDDTQTELAFDDGGTIFLNVGSDNTVCITGTLVARSTTGDSHSWEIKGLFSNAGGTLAYVGNPATVTTGSTSAGAITWVVQVDADDTNDRIYVKATGAAATTITWIFTVDFVTLTN